MAMTMTGEIALAAARPRVWAGLNDPAILKQCIPGCHALDWTGETTLVAVVKVKIGPVGATFKGNVELHDVDPPNGYRIQAAGQGGIAGVASGGATVGLADAPAGGTIVSYAVEANVGGTMAKMVSRLAGGIAKGMAERFFAKFAAALAAEP